MPPRRLRSVDQFISLFRTPRGTNLLEFFIYSSIPIRVYSKTELKITMIRLCRLQEIIISILSDRDYIQVLYGRLMLIKAMER